MRVLVLLGASWLGCAPGAPPVDGAVRLPRGAEKLCSARSPYGSFSDGAPWSPLAERAEQEAGGPFDYTAYVLPPPLPWRDAPNVAVRHFIDHLPSGTTAPAFRHRASMADQVVVFGAPAAPGGGWARHDWLVELYSGVKAGHPFCRGEVLEKDEVLAVVARPAPP